MTITLDAIPIQAPTVIGRELDSEAVLVQPDLAQVKVINATGAQIWSLMDGTRSIGEIVRCLCQFFNVNQNQAEQDTLDFIEQLADRGLVRFK